MLVETYRNTLYDDWLREHGHPPAEGGQICRRYYVHDKVMVGGSILDADDGRHLVRDYGIDGFVNVETEHDDSGKGLERLLEVRVPDNGSPIPPQYIWAVVGFVASLGAGSKLYVHCQAGGSRSPAIAYLILRTRYGMSPDEALGAIRAEVPSYAQPQNAAHQSYLRSIESVIARSSQCHSA